MKEVMKVQRTEREVPNWIVASRTVPSAASLIMM